MKTKRQCGTCKACCYTHQVVTQITPTQGELVTGLFEHCKYEFARGCRIYGNHPPACKEYRCAWLDGKVDGGRPDELGLVVDQYVQDGIPCLSVMEAFKGASHTKRARKFLRILAETHIVALVGPSGTLTILCPPEKAAEARVIADFFTQGETNRVNL